MDKLDLKDRRLMYELDLNSRASFKELGRKLRMAKETVRFRYNRLRKSGYIKNCITTINVSSLNKFYYKLFYKFHKTNPQIDKDIIENIKKSKKIAYFASTEGRYDITFLILAKDMNDLYEFLVPFREKFGEFILEQEILTMPNVHRFNFRFFFEKGELKHTKSSRELIDSSIDVKNKMIIGYLARNSRIQLVDLARVINGDINSVKYRIKNLKKLGIIGSYVLDVNFEKFNRQHFQINFILKDHSLINSFITFAGNDFRSTFATVTLGKYDLALEYVVSNVKELRDIIDKIKNKYFDYIIDHDVFILNEHKVNWYPN